VIGMLWFGLESFLGSALINLMVAFLTVVDSGTLFPDVDGAAVGAGTNSQTRVGELLFVFSATACVTTVKRNAKESKGTIKYRLNNFLTLIPFFLLTIFMF
jgi:hypothetical protein